MILWWSPFHHNYPYDMCSVASQFEEIVPKRDSKSRKYDFSCVIIIIFNCHYHCFFSTEKVILNSLTLSIYTTHGSARVYRFLDPCTVKHWIIPSHNILHKSLTNLLKLLFALTSLDLEQKKFHRQGSHCDFESFHCTNLLHAKLDWRCCLTIPKKLI